MVACHGLAPTAPTPTLITLSLCSRKFPSLPHSLPSSWGDCQSVPGPVLPSFMPHLCRITLHVCVSPPNAALSVCLSVCRVWLLFCWWCKTTLPPYIVASLPPCLDCTIRLRRSWTVCGAEEEEE